MNTKMFPRAVVYAPHVHHHFVIWVDRAAQEVTLACQDCLDVFSVPTSKLDMIRTLISQDEDAQCIAWIESGNEA